MVWIYGAVISKMIAHSANVAANISNLLIKVYGIVCESVDFLRTSGA